MLTAAKAIANMCAAISLERYREDENLRLSMERRIEIIGEAARRVSDSFKSEHPEIPWQQIIAQRNMLIHEYDGIDHERIWRLTRDYIPQLAGKLEGLLPPLPPEPTSDK